ncbi:hypothetical protein LCW_02440 [Latilactobacillus curvatus]|uniref:oligosaccharide flippase family protein n=1 Tax=Latilactobacillus curvatus TaxID=28038 RepID=UPI000849F79C|nr:oligosaccharide flippase family protein [Latilactobacillus curvatus]AOO75002.1 hypothetical protein LCW_02440 [Latilactobacillus curvatus]
MNMKQVLRNLSYTVLSNFLSLFVSTLVVLIVPKLIGVEDYGYWQLYMFYTTYVTVLHLGWFDGIYLRYGGREYDSLDKSLFNSQIVLSLCLETLIAAVIYCYSFFVNNNNQSYIIVMTAIAMLIMNMGLLSVYLLQITNQIRKYAIYTVVGKLIYISIVIVSLLLGVRSFRILIVADLIGKFSSLLYGIICCQDLVFRKLELTKNSFREAYFNISVGIKLLIANLSSNLVVGVIRYGIQTAWGIKIFGKISLTLSISNLLMVFIGAVSLVLFPTLRRIQTDLEKVYSNIRIILISILLLGLLLYFPVQLILPIWLPKYKDSLVYMAILFPMCLFDGKFEILINTFMKSLRLEKTLLLLNIFSVVISCIITVVNIIFFKNLSAMMFSIVFVLAVRSTIGELIVWKVLKIHEYKQLFLEIGIVIVFILSTWYLSLLIALFIYLLILIIYTYFHFQKIKGALLYFCGIE